MFDFRMGRNKDAFPKEIILFNGERLRVAKFEYLDVDWDDDDNMKEIWKPEFYYWTGMKAESNFVCVTFSCGLNFVSPSVKFLPERNHRFVEYVKEMLEE